MITDRYGLPLSTRSVAARDAYVRGADAVLGAMAAPREHLQRALDADAGFALAWIARARARFLEADVAGAREDATRARELVATGTPRERSHVNALALAIEGRPVDALEATRSHLAQHGSDGMVLAPATGVFGLVGFSGRQQREDELHDWLQQLAPRFGADWWFNAVFAFAECETGRLDSALDRIERSLAACPDNAHGAHVLAHVRYERGEVEAAARFLAGWLPNYDRGGLMHCHLSWHAAMSALALGLRDEAWSIYRRAVHPGAAWGPPLNVVSDAPSFLWRAELAGAPRAPDLWQEVHRYATQQFPAPGVAFADVHVGVACAAVGDGGRLRDLADGLRRRLDAGRLPAGDVVPRLVEGLGAFGRGEFDAAVAWLEGAQGQAVRIGGSRAQRDLIEHTLLAAYLACGREGDAQRHLLQSGRSRPRVAVRGFAPAGAG